MRILSLMAAAVTALSAMPLFAYAKDMPDVGAKAAVVMDADSGEVLFSKNETLRLPMASTTKIMSALVVLSQDALDEPFTVDDRAVDTEGSTMGLEKGDIDLAKRDERIEEIVREARENPNESDDVYDDGLRQFPDSHKLMWWWLMSTNDTDRIVTLGEKLLAESTDDTMRPSVIFSLSHAYMKKGWEDKAHALAKTLPGLWYTSDVLSASTSSTMEIMRSSVAALSRKSRLSSLLSTGK